MTEEPTTTETQDAPWEEAEATNQNKNAYEKRGRGQKKIKKDPNRVKNGISLQEEISMKNRKKK